MLVSFAVRADALVIQVLFLNLKPAFQLGEGMVRGIEEIRDLAALDTLEVSVVRGV
jgi:hypothetical protein